MPPIPKLNLSLPPADPAGAAPPPPAAGSQTPAGLGVPKLGLGKLGITPSGPGGDATCQSHGGSQTPSGMPTGMPKLGLAKLNLGPSGPGSDGTASSGGGGGGGGGGGVAPLTSPPALLTSPRGGGDKLICKGCTALVWKTAVVCPTCGTAVEDPAAGGDGAPMTPRARAAAALVAAQEKDKVIQTSTPRDMTFRRDSSVEREENECCVYCGIAARPKVTTATPITPALVASWATGCPGRRKAAALRLRYPRTSLALGPFTLLRLAPRTGIFIDLDDDYCPLDERRPEDGPKVHEHCWDDFAADPTARCAWCFKAVGGGAGYVPTTPRDGFKPALGREVDPTSMYGLHGAVRRRAIDRPPFRPLRTARSRVLVATSVCRDAVGAWARQHGQHAHEGRRGRRAAGRRQARAPPGLRRQVQRGEGVALPVVQEGGAPRRRDRGPRRRAQGSLL